MGDTPTSPTRRQLLQYFLAGSLSGLAGCNQNPESGTTALATNTTTAPTTSTSSTIVDNQAPRILSYKAHPKDYGKVLAVLMEGWDGDGIEYASISYGNLGIEETLGTEQVSLEGVLEGVPDAQAGDPGQVKYLLRDSSGNETEAEAYPDRQAPEIALVTETPTTAEEIKTVLEGKDNVGLHDLQLLLNGEPVSEQVLTGQKTVSQERDLTGSIEAMKPGEMNSIEALLEDAMGNTARKGVGQYVRKYDVLGDARLDIGAVYVPWAKGGRHCFEGDAQAEIGYYGDSIISAETASKHIDQMTGFGISRILFNFKGTEVARREISELLNSDILNQIYIEPFYPIKDKRWQTDLDWKEDIIPTDMGYIRDHLFSRQRLAKIQNRPVIQIWAALKWSSWGPSKYRENIMDAWGGYEAFLRDVRSELTVDGINPFIIANIGSGGRYGSSDSDTNLPEMVKLFDGISTWTASGALEPGKEVSWDDAIGLARDNFAGAVDFVNQNGMEFIPMVFPGFDDRSNPCWGQNRHIPRNPTYFRKLLELADEHRTTNLVDIATWNDWPEGHQIEPGSFKGTDYGTEYLQVVKEFQS